MSQLIKLGAMHFICSLGIAFAEEMPPPERMDRSSTSVKIEEAVRDSVRRSLPYLQREGVAWMNDHNCMSCHHVPLLLWTHRAANAHGVSIDLQKLDEWDRWSQKDSLAHRYKYKIPKDELESLDVVVLPAGIKEKLKSVVDRPAATEDEFIAFLASVLTEEDLKLYKNILVNKAALTLYSFEGNAGGLDVLALLILGDDQQRQRPVSPAFRQELIQLIARMQLEDGSWSPGQQFATMRDWTLDAANQTTTMWATLALAAELPVDDLSSAEINQALSYLRQQPNRSNNREWIATRLLFEHRFGTTQSVEQFKKELIAARNPDGGWGWREGGPSDPYTTGIVLYVLLKTSNEESIEAVHDARDYLLKTQNSDGSWLTPAANISKTSDVERLKTRDEIYHYWGTAWSVLALLESLN